jgi:hypothetical protein
MRFAFECGGAAEKYRVESHRNPWVGTMRIKADGVLVAFVDPTRLSTHLDVKRVKRYTFAVGRVERHEITIEHERPILLGGLRPNDYRVFVDGHMAVEHHGY